MAHGILKTIAFLSDPVSFCQFQCHISCFELTWLMWLMWLARLRTLFHFVPERAALGTPTSRSWGWRKRHWCNRACSDPRPPQSPWSWFNIVSSHCLILSRPGWTPCSKIFRQSLHVHLPCSLECAHYHDGHSRGLGNGSSLKVLLKHIQHVLLPTASTSSSYTCWYRHVVPMHVNEACTHFHKLTFGVCELLCVTAHNLSACTHCNLKNYREIPFKKRFNQVFPVFPKYVVPAHQTFQRRAYIYIYHLFLCHRGIGHTTFQSNRVAATVYRVHMRIFKLKNMKNFWSSKGLTLKKTPTLQGKLGMRPDCNILAVWYTRMQFHPVYPGNRL